ncbi:class I SAM-dependent methyltransferase [Polynucleobacter sp. UB-Siik-W21]|uniref:50S ribosomal protein L11 methyltransferase n=1 Tax=Polynucleobacter sp. UB-Siik-W21 TaxID=1855646 RepID=UPI001BFDD546|nr:class I SAM-dependent methyltransferase [Polynucleobacter sp. UB-Siik-W21]QWD71536.1 class I SAM-dependent methyltransferase [Polynucleobacter sp. UB-Siik-W21]
MIHWDEAGQSCAAKWHSENGIASHKKIQIGDDTLTADIAYRMACEGTAILYRGDFQNARQLLQALVRRVDKPSKKSKRVDRIEKDKTKSSLDTFNLHRLSQSQRARILGMLLIQVNADHTISLRRAPDVVQACLEAYGGQNESYVISLRELLGVISAHEWRKKGVPILARDDEEIRIHPHYGVFSPIRGEYVELVLKAPLPSALKENSTAFDIGVGTGVLSIVLAMREIKKIIGTDQDDRAIACAQENIDCLNLDNQIEIQKRHLFPEGNAALVVCNPPWLPARPSSSLEHAVYDPDSQMLKGFLSQLKDHLLPKGEGWLILSDLAEHLGLRTREELLAWIDAAGLKVIARLDAKPQHQKVFDKTDALHKARSQETTSLWRLAIFGNTH